MALAPEPRTATQLRIRLVVAVAATVLVVVIASVIVRAGRHRTSTTASSGATATASPSATKTPTTADIYTLVKPSVVVVRTAKGALGSGIVASDTGTIITADHVVTDGSAITVVFADGTTSPATVAAADKTTDIAALTPATLPQPVVPATLGGSAAVGSDVVAIGDPLGLTYSVSSGVVSGTGRSADTEGGKLTGLIQFDASVNPGSSGGPLLDAKGAVIGVVISIADPSKDDGFAGIAFAEPIGAALGGAGRTGSGRGPQI